MLARARGHFRVSQVSLDGQRKRGPARSLGETQRDLTPIPKGSDGLQVVPSQSLVLIMVYFVH